MSLAMQRAVREALTIALAIFDSTASRWRWYRRWQGGHWERWFIGPPVASTMWLQNVHGERPGLGVICDECEDWTPRKALPSSGSPYRDNASERRGGAGR
jgi:hypothetical protein